MRNPASVAEIPFVSRTQVALEIRSKGQVVTIDNIVGRRQHISDFGIQDGKRTSDSETVRKCRQPDKISFQPENLGISSVVREKQIRDAGVKNRRLQILNIDKEGGAVNLQRVIQVALFDIDFKVINVVGVQ